MRFRVAAAALALVLSGCGTPADVKRTGVVWNGTVAARYDQLARCLSTQTTLYYKASLQFAQNEPRATVTFSIPVTGIPVEVYELRQVSDIATEVAWSTRLERGQKTTGKPLYLLHLCGAALLPAASLPATRPADPAPSAAPVWAPEPVGGTWGGR